MQVLGAYGFRGYFERKAHFIESIPFAIQNLRDLLAKNDFPYPYLVTILKELTELPKFAPKPKVQKDGKATVKLSITTVEIIAIFLTEIKLIWK